MNKVICYDMEDGWVAVQTWNKDIIPKWAIIWFWIEVSDWVLEILEWENRAAQVRKILDNIVDKQFNTLNKWDE